MTIAADTFFEEKGIETPQEFKLIKRSLYKKDLSRKFLVLMGAKTFSKEELLKYKYQSEIKQISQYMIAVHTAKQKNAIDIARHILDFLKTHVSSEISWNNYDCIEVFDFKKNGLGLKILSNVFPSMVSMRKICCS